MSKDIYELNYSFRNTTALQVDSQDELLRKLEMVIKQFAMDREQNSVKIADLKTFLDRNIHIMKNNWDDKRCVAIQTDPPGEVGRGHTEYASRRSIPP